MPDEVVVTDEDRAAARRVTEQPHAFDATRMHLLISKTDLETDIAYEVARERLAAEARVAGDLGAAYWNRPENALAMCDMILSGPVAHMRRDGWMVAVHNDYVIAGERMTFWGFSRGNQWVQGEGRTDREAVESAYAATQRQPPAVPR